MFPRLYKLWILFEAIKNKKGQRGDGHEGIDGEAPEFAKAARQILQRGFDAVIFGHTHHAGKMELHRSNFTTTPDLLCCRPITS